jgi:hypothetical protein
MRPLFHLVALSLGLSGLTALAGCSKSSSDGVPRVGGECTSYPPVTGTGTVTRIEPADAYSPKAGDQPCNHVFYDWSGPGPDRFPNMANFFAAPACIASANVHVGSTFGVIRQDLKTGTCAPSEQTFLDPASAACDKACK